MKSAVLTEFAKVSSDEEIKFLGMKLVERLQNDLSDVLEYIGKNNAKNHNIDSVFRSATSANEVYDLCDAFQKAISLEADKRKIGLVRGVRN